VVCAASYICTFCIPDLLLDTAKLRAAVARADPGGPGPLFLAKSILFFYIVYNV